MFFFKQKTAYEMRISDWSSDVCSSDLVEGSGEFSLNVPSRAVAAAALAVGSVSGRERDKSQIEGLSMLPVERIGAPLLDGCLGWMECRVIAEPHIQERSDLFLVEVVDAWADPRAFRDGQIGSTSCRERGSQ